MLVGMPGTEAEMEAKHIEGGVCLEVIQDEEKLLLEGVEVAFRPARRDLLDFAPQEPFQLDGVIGGCEGRGEYVEFWTAHADSGFNHAVMLFSIQFYEFFVGHGLIIFITEKIPYCTMVSNTKETLGTSLLLLDWTSSSICLSCHFAKVNMATVAPIIAINMSDWVSHTYP